jgi:hypothetical protein
MSENETDDTELFDSDTSEQVTDTGSDTEDQKSESDSEQSNDVQLEEPKKPTAEQQAQKQVEALTLKVISGDVDINELPPDQKWMKPAVENKLRAMEKQPEIANLVAKEVAKKEDEAEYKRLKSSLSNLGLSKSQQKELQEEFSELVKHLPKGIALAKSIKIVGAAEEDNSQRKSDAKLPPAGNKEAVSDDVLIKPDDPRFEKLSGDEKVKMYEKIRIASKQGTL